MIIYFITSFAFSSWLSIAVSRYASGSNSITTSGVAQVVFIFSPFGVYRFPTVYLSEAPSAKSLIVWIDHLPNVCVPTSCAPICSCNARAIISHADAVIQSTNTTMGRF